MTRKESIILGSAIGIAFLIMAYIFNSVLVLKSVPEVSNIPKIEQQVYILPDDKKSTLEYRWMMENEEALKEGKLKMSDSPYSEEKTIYKLKTSMDSLTSFVYGTQTEIERQKCIEYNKFIDMRTNLLRLNKPVNCK